MARTIRTEEKVTAEPQDGEPEYHSLVVYTDGTAVLVGVHVSEARTYSGEDECRLVTRHRFATEAEARAKIAADKRYWVDLRQRRADFRRSLEEPVALTPPALAVGACVWAIRAGKRVTGRVVQHLATRTDGCDVMVEWDSGEWAGTHGPAPSAYLRIVEGYDPEAAAT